MITFENFVKGLADFKVSSEVAENNGTSDIENLLKKHSESFRRIFYQILKKIKLSTEEENNVKQLIGILGGLKNSPAKKKISRDHLDNVVNRLPSGGDMDMEG